MKNLRKWGAVAAWLALIFALSAQAQFPKPEQRLLDLLLEKSAHTFEYAVLAALVLRALDPDGPGCWRAITGAILFTWLFALSDEFHQRFVPGRSADWWDVLFDWLGAAVGAGLWLYWSSVQHKKTLSQEL